MQVPRQSAELWIDEDGTVNFKFHINRGNFDEARIALEKFVKIIQTRINNERKCPFFKESAAARGLHT